MLFVDSVNPVAVEPNSLSDVFSIVADTEIITAVSPSTIVPKFNTLSIPLTASTAASGCGTSSPEPVKPDASIVIGNSSNPLLYDRFNVPVSSPVDVEW